MRIAVTGHRPHKLGNEYNGIGPFSDHIRKELQFVIETMRPKVIITGMALGVDTIWAQLAITNEIDFVAAIPFKGQELAWPYDSQQRYHKILKHRLCLEHVVSTGGYASYKMQLRNEWMVRNCDLLVAVYDGTEGGTGNCVKYAESISKSILRINPNPNENTTSTNQNRS